MSGIEKIITYLKFLGVELRLDTFSNRKQIQKIIYLIENLVYLDLGYRYSWYLHGPYSPDLTQELFKNEKIKSDVATNLDEDEVKKLMTLREFLGDDINSSDNLEILGSLCFLLSIGKHAKKSDKEMIEILKEKKRFIDESKINYYYKKLTEFKL